LTENGLGYILGDFSQEHLVTLASNEDLIGNFFSKGGSGTQACTSSFFIASDAFKKP
jgi:hypothetical protein